MFSVFRRYPRALILSVLFHVGLLILIFVSFDFDESKKLVKQGDLVKTVKAKVVDQQQLEASKEKKQSEIDKKKKAEQAEKRRKAEADKKKREEAKRKADEKKKKLAEEKKKKEQAKRKAAEKKKTEALKKKQAEAKKKEAEAKKKEADKQKKLAEEKRKKAEEKRIAEEKKAAEEKKKADEKRKAEEKIKAEAEKRRLAEEEQKRKQDELKAQLEAEETQRRLSSLRDAYRLAIKQKIERNWRRPQESGKMPDCEVRVMQGPGGIILDVAFGNCKGGTTTYRASIENAVYKAEPLPKPGDPALFEREIIFKFKPE